MADNKAATIIEAARALVEKAFHLIRPYDVVPLKWFASSPVLTDLELRDLHAKLCAYSEELAVLGFSYRELVIPSSVWSPGSADPDAGRCYKVESLKDLASGIVDAGKGRRFLVMSWNEPRPGTVVLRRNSNPDCWVEVASYLDRKEPEAAVTCLLLGEGDRGTPFDALKKAVSRAEHRYWGERDRVAKAAIRDPGKTKKRGRNAR
jgi:hypothetical protein